MMAMQMTLLAIEFQTSQSSSRHIPATLDAIVTIDEIPQASVQSRVTGKLYLQVEQRQTDI